MPQRSKQKKKPVIVFGASGHAKVVIDVLENQGGYEVNCLIDDNPVIKGQSIYGYRVSGGKADLLAEDCGEYLVAIGNNRIRQEIASWMEQKGFTLATAAVHPSCQLARGVSIGDGTVVMAGSVVNSDSVIGKNTIINTGATIDHDCCIGNSVHVAPGATICGGVLVGDLTLIGAGATIHPNVKIGKNVTVGAGATVLNDVEDNVSVVGTPAKVIK